MDQNKIDRALNRFNNVEDFINSSPIILSSSRVQKDTLLAHFNYNKVIYCEFSLGTDLFSKNGGSLNSEEYNYDYTFKEYFTIVEKLKQRKEKPMENNTMEQLISLFKTGEVSIGMNSQADKDIITAFFSKYGIGVYKGYIYSKVYPNTFHLIDSLDFCDSKLEHHYNNFADFLNGKLARPEFIDVKLNDSHDAKVYKDKVVIGRQTFTIKSIEKVLAASRVVSFRE